MYLLIYDVSKYLNSRISQMVQLVEVNKQDRDNI